MWGVPRSVCPPVGPSVRPSVGVAVATGKHPQPGGFGEERAGKAPPNPLPNLSLNIKKIGTAAAGMERSRDLPGQG